MCIYLYVYTVFISLQVRIEPERVCIIVCACAILHNIAKILGEPDIEDDDDDEEVENEAYNGPVNDGQAVRDHICNHYFNQ